MPMYHYEATDRTGRKLVGSMNGTDEASIQQALLQRGLTPLLIEAPAGAVPSAGRRLGASGTPPPAAASPSPSFPNSQDPIIGGILPPTSPYPPAPAGAQHAGAQAPPRRRSNVTVSNRHLAQFYRQLASSVKAGLPLTQALPSIVSQIQDRHLRAAGQDMLNSVSQGHPMSKAMERHPRVFRQGHVGLVRAGESAGFLERAFNELATQCEADFSVELASRFNIISWILNWMIIPPIPGLVWFLSHTGMMTAADGEFSPQGLTRLLLQSLLVIVVAFVLWNFIRPWGFRALKGTPIGLAWENLMAVLPVVGTRRRRLDSAKTLGALSSAVSAGVPHSIAWELAMEAADTEYYRQRLAAQLHPVRRGSTIAEAMAASGLYDHNTLQLAQSGEASGNLPDMLQQATYFQREEARHIGMLTPWVSGLAMYFFITALLAVLYVYFAYRVYSGIVERGLAM